MSISRTAVFFAFALIAGPASTARADWPERPVKFISPYAAGGVNDLMGRVAAEAIGKRIGRPVVVENRTGGSGVIGADYVAKSKADGYTYLVAAVSIITDSLIKKEMPYADGDLVPVGMIGLAPSIIVVNPSVPANDLAGFLAWGRQQGEKGVNWATAGTGSTPHFVAQMLREAAHTPFNVVPYRGGSESIAAVLSNNVSATSEAGNVVLPLVKAGKLRALAAAYGKRLTAWPSIPTAAEQGFPGVNIAHWGAIFAPKDTPQPILLKMNAELRAATQSQQFADKLTPLGIEPAPYTLEEFRKFMSSERARLARLARDGHMQQD